MQVNLIMFMFVIFVSIIMVFHFNAKRNYKRVRDIAGPTIFVSVPSYRDKECPETVYNLFENAKYPSRLRLGIFQQNSSDDIDCELRYCSLDKNCRNNQITIKRVDYKDAKGPTHARVKILDMIQDEDFFLSIDSHTRFAKNWDEKLLDQWGKCKNKKAILTTYPRPYEPEKHDNHKSGLKKIPHLCKTWFDKNMPRGKAIYVDRQDAPILTSLYSANFAFMPMSAMKEAPLDPHTPNLFSGEEFYVAARFWTHGYDFYTPQKDIIYHFYSRDEEPKFWEEVPNYKEQRERSENRIRKQFGISYDSNKIYDENLDKYEMGNKRTFKQYLDFSKVDLENEKETQDNCKIGDIKYVDY